MAKSRYNRKSFMKSVRSTSRRALPVVSKGLKTVGNTAKYVAVKSAPVVEKGASVVYGTLAKGLDLGFKGVKTLAKGAKKMSMGHSKKRGGTRRR
jgi:hypothetical protein